jgi:NitT/TauT family transport system permease protein
MAVKSVGVTSLDVRVRRTRVGRGVRWFARQARELVWGVLLLVLFFALWEGIARWTNQPSYLIPTPSLIASTAAHQASQILLPATWTTLKEVVAGFGLAVAVALPLATAMAHSRTISRALNPLIVSSQTIPVIAIAPIFIIWFGFGLLPKVLIAALIAFFPVVINATAGQMSVDRETLNLLNSLGAGTWQSFFKLRFPASLPYVFIGLKQAAVISVIGAIVGEWVGATSGLGPVMLTADAAFQTPLVFAAILYLSIIGIILFGIVCLAERLVIPWHFISRHGSGK